MSNALLFINSLNIVENVLKMLLNVGSRIYKKNIVKIDNLIIYIY